MGKKTDKGPMKYIRYILLAVIMVLAVTIAFANRETVSLALWPEGVTSFLGFGYTMAAPLFLIVGGAFGLGLVLGLAWEWLRERSQRVEARQNRRELDRLRAEHGVQPKPETSNPAREQVMAILDEADGAA